MNASFGDNYYKAETEKPKKLRDNQAIMIKILKKVGDCSKYSTCVIIHSRGGNYKLNKGSKQGEFCVILERTQNFSYNNKNSGEIYRVWADEALRQELIKKGFEKVKDMRYQKTMRSSGKK